MVLLTAFFKNYPDGCQNKDRVINVPSSHKKQFSAFLRKIKNRSQVKEKSEENYFSPFF